MKLEMSCRYSLFFLRLLVVLMLFHPPAFAGGNLSNNAGGVVAAVPEDVAILVAEQYAEERWPGCRYLSHIPYYALDGSVTAWAVQFVKRGALVKSEEDLLPLLLERLDMRDLVYNQTEEETPAPIDAGIDARDMITLPDEATGQPMPGPFVVTQELLDSARRSQEAASLEHARYMQGREERTQERLAALEASTLSREVGTIVIAARDDLYPFIESHGGPAAHLKFTETAARLGGVPREEIRSSLVEKVYYPGPMSYWLQPTASTSKRAGVGGDHWIDAGNEEWLAPTERRRSSGTIGMRAAFDEELGVAPAEVWASIQSALGDGGSVRLAETRTTGENKLEGVPFYFQSRYGRNSCGPTTFATVLGYWDTKGYGTLVDNGESLHDGPGYEDMLVYYCMRDTGYGPTLGTWPVWDPVKSGIRKVCEDTAYANFVDVQVNEFYPVPFATLMKGQIDLGRPVAYCWYIDNGDPFTGHWSTIVGYRETSGAKIATLHTNHSTNYPDGLELNTSNVWNTNEWCETIRVQEDPFDCLWSEGWEASHIINGYHIYGDPSWGYISVVNGVSTPVWLTTYTRSHSRPYDPYPEQGSHSNSIRTSGPVVSGSTDFTVPYAPKTDSVFFYGPFSTLGRTAGEFRAMMALEIEDHEDDAVYLVASTDGITWQGTRFFDPNLGTPFSTGHWFSTRLDLANVPNLGNLLNREKVWVGVYFHSDDDANSSQGAFVDNLSISLWPRIENPFGVPATPTVSQGTYESNITVSCPPKAGATHYRFFRWSAGKQSWEPITGWTEERVVVDGTALIGYKYEYRYQVANNPTGTNASPLSAKAEGWRGGRSPFNFTASLGTYSDRVHLHWMDVDNKWFAIERCVGSPDGQWIPLASDQNYQNSAIQTGTQYHYKWIDEDVNPGVDYYYRVRGGLLGTWTANAGPRLGYTKLPVMTGVTTVPRYGSVLIKWPFRTDRYYTVYARESLTSDPVPISFTFSGSEFLHTPVLPAGQYRYYHVTQSRTQAGIATSELGNPIQGYSTFAKPRNPSATEGTSSNNVTVTWEWPYGEPFPHYHVQRSTSPNGPNWSSVMPWSRPVDLSFTDTTATPGVDYYYRVRAAKDSSGFAAGDYSDVATGWRKMGTPSNVSATDGTQTDGVLVSWNAPPGATAYRVARFTSPTANIGILLSNWISEREFFDATAQPNTIYYYRVTAAANIQGYRAGSSSAFDSGWRKIHPPIGLVASQGTHDDGISLDWMAVPGAASYQVYRSTDMDDPQDAVSGWITASNYLDTTCEPGHTYYYAVRAATTTAGDNPTGRSNSASGWRRLVTPANLAASQGEPDEVSLTWDEVPFAQYYAVYIAESVSGPKTMVQSNVTTTSISHKPSYSGIAYFYFVKAFIAPGDTQVLQSDFSTHAVGWYVGDKVSFQSNCTDAVAVMSSITLDQSTDVAVFDDWTCPNGEPIKTLRWWGSYIGYSTTLSTEVMPPATKVKAFILRMYRYTDGTVPVPGVLIYETRSEDFKETWNCAVPRIGIGRRFEHEFAYQVHLPNPWRQERNVKYFLSIQAEFDVSVPANFWGWMSSDVHQGAAAVGLQEGEFTALAYPTGHANAGQSLSTSFEMETGNEITPTATPTATPSPTLTPTPTPTPDGKWSQLPNMIDGNGLTSYQELAPSTVRVITADDWVCLDGSPILRIKWWGSYPEYETNNPSLLPPPDDGVSHFLITWYTATGQQALMPGSVLAQETVTQYDETAIGTVMAHYGLNFYQYEHLYEYECTLSTPWAQTQGTPYFLSIEAVYPGSHQYNWAWFTSESKEAFPAHQKWSEEDGWAPLYYEQWHRLWPGVVSAAFELYTTLPTPTPTPQPSPTLSPSPTPTVSPTPFPSPSPTPIGMRFRHAPNTIDGISVAAWRSTSKADRLTVGSARIADDWQSVDDRPLGRIRWWGVYEGWNSSTSSPCNPPTNKPGQFELRWSSLADGPPYQPGTLLNSVSLPPATETWYAAVERWDAPGSYLHVFEYETTLPSMWESFFGQSYFLEIEAVYTSAPAQYAWGWMTSEDDLDHAAVESVDSAPWSELLWPPVHRLAGTPLDMAFEMWAVDELPTPTPEPTSEPNPTETPTPTPTPYGWTGTFQPPNLVDGFNSQSITDKAGTFFIEVADDITPGRQTVLNSLVWWGSYPGWRSDTNTPGNSPASLEGLIGNLDRPNERPLAYILRLYEPASTAMGEPGELLHEIYLPDWTEEWVAALPRFGHPGTFEHEYVYTAPIASPVVLEAGTRYFISLQAWYAEPELDYEWGWLAGSQQAGSSAFTRTGSGNWAPMLWPTGHRLASGPMDMSFDIREGLLPSPTFTPSPTPTAVMSPTPTPVGWFVLNITADHGDVGRIPDQPAYAPGTDVELIPKGEAGYRFASWSGDVLPEEMDDDPLHVTVDRNLTISARFDLTPYLLTTTIDAGSISVTPQQSSFFFGAAVAVEALPASGSKFIRWELVEGDLFEETLSQNPLTFEVHGNVTLHALTVPEVNGWMLY